MRGLWVIFLPSQSNNRLGDSWRPACCMRENNSCLIHADGHHDDVGNEWRSCGFRMILILMHHPEIIHSFIGAPRLHGCVCPMAQYYIDNEVKATCS